jgi:hypothetical protein
MESVEPVHDAAEGGEAVELLPADVVAASVAQQEAVRRDSEELHPV